MPLRGTDRILPYSPVCALGTSPRGGSAGFPGFPLWENCHPPIPREADDGRGRFFLPYFSFSKASATRRAAPSPLPRWGDSALKNR